MSGIAESIAKTIVRLLGAKRAMLTIILLGAILTYSGVSLFVAVFAIYPFAAQMFREANIPKRLIPGTIALGAFTFTMDALPGTPQIQNVIPISFFGTNIYAAPILGCSGAVFILVLGVAYLQWQRRRARDGYGHGHKNEPETVEATGPQLHPLTALFPLALVAGANFVMVRWISSHYGAEFDFAGL